MATSIAEADISKAGNGFGEPVIGLEPGCVDTGTAAFETVSVAETRSQSHGLDGNFHAGAEAPDAIVIFMRERADLGPRPSVAESCAEERLHSVIGGVGGGARAQRVAPGIDTAVEPAVVVTETEIERLVERQVDRDSEAVSVVREAVGILGAETGIDVTLAQEAGRRRRRRSRNRLRHRTDTGGKSRENTEEFFLSHVSFLI